MKWIVPLLLALLACGPTLRETPASIHRIDNGVLRNCIVTLGWSRDELIRSCGEPDAQVDWVRGNQCLVYRTDASTFSGSPAAPVVAVCLFRRDMSQRQDLRTYRSKAERMKFADVLAVDTVIPLTRMSMPPMEGVAPPAAEEAPSP